MNNVVESALLRAAAALNTLTYSCDKANAFPPSLFPRSLLLSTAADGEEPTSAGGILIFFPTC